MSQSPPERGFRELFISKIAILWKITYHYENQGYIHFVTFYLDSLHLLSNVVFIFVAQLGLPL